MRNYRRIIFRFTIISFALSLYTLGYCQHSPYKLLQTIQLGGESKWDYLAFDQTHNVLYVSHGDRVTVISGESDKVIGEILHTDGVHGIAVAPDLNRGFTSNGRSSSVTIFDLNTLQTIDTINIGSGKNPDAILYEPLTKRVFTFNGKTNDATVIDAITGTVIGSIPLGARPEFATCDSAGIIYDALESTNEVAVIDAKKMTIIDRWRTGSGDEPSCLSLDKSNSILYVGCGNAKMIVMDTKTGKVITSLQTGKGTDACDFNPLTKSAYSSNGEGSLTVIKENSPNSFKIIENLKTQLGARTMAIDYIHDVIYLATAEYEEVDKLALNARPKAKPNTFIILKYGH